MSSNRLFDDYDSTVVVLNCLMLIIGDYTQNKTRTAVCVVASSKRRFFSLAWLQQISNKNVFVNKLSLLLFFTVGIYSAIQAVIV